MHSFNAAKHWIRFLRPPVILQYLATNNLKQSEKTFPLQNNSSDTNNPVNSVYFRHPIAAQHRLLFESQLIKTGSSSKQGYLKDCFGQNTLFVGSKQFFAGYDLEISLISKTPVGEIYSFHQFYDPNSADNNKILKNPLYISSKVLKSYGDFCMLRLKVARLSQDHLLDDFGRNKPRSSKCRIKIYPTGKPREKRTTPQQLNRKFNLNNIQLAIRRFKREPNENPVFDPKDPILYSTVSTIVYKCDNTKNDRLPDDKKK